jgi:hypothetical protein
VTNSDTFFRDLSPRAIDSAEHVRERLLPQEGNTFNKYKWQHPAWLGLTQQKIDTAVFAAYGLAGFAER